MIAFIAGLICVTYCHGHRAHRGNLNFKADRSREHSSPSKNIVALAKQSDDVASSKQVGGLKTLLTAYGISNAIDSGARWKGLFSGRNLAAAAAVSLPLLNRMRRRKPKKNTGVLKQVLLEQSKPDLLQLSAALDRLVVDCASDELFSLSANVLLRYFDNIAEHPHEPKFRRIPTSNQLFTKYIGFYPAALECLEAVGFQESLSVDGVLELTDPTLDASRMNEAADVVRAELQMIEMRSRWPAPLRDLTLGVYRKLRADAYGQSLLSDLNAELCDESVSELLQYGDNLEQVRFSLQQGPAAFSELVRALRDARESESTAANEPLGSDTLVDSATSRVLHLKNGEDWYDLLLEAEGLVVVKFGATWCGPCKMVEPLFEKLSTFPEFADVTFVSINVDDFVDSTAGAASPSSVGVYPTFKFYRNAAEEQLPVEGADIATVARVLKSLA